ncbi:hypothetical protein ASF29_18680 [Rhizobium sp. Leaf262]|nr:hypothetical protein ASF29_18680 [Rhizobium sp. Leaf262]
MSLYVKAWLFLAVFITALITSPGWGDAIGLELPNAPVIITLVFTTMLFLVIVCPRCRAPLFRTDMKFFYIYHPWPNKTCPQCGHDHAKKPGE